MADKFRDRRTGDEKTLTVACSELDNTDKDPESATILIFDRDRLTTGTADSGSTTTIVDSARTEDADLWIGIEITIDVASTGKTYASVVTGFVGSTTNEITFNEIPVAVAEDDTYTLEGYPVMPRTAATITDNDVSKQITGSDATARPGKMRSVWHIDFGTDSQRHDRDFVVKGPKEQ